MCGGNRQPVLYSLMNKLRDEETIKKLAMRVSSLRTFNEMSQEQLAYEAGMKATQLRRIESGQINTGISHIKAIALVFNMNLASFFEYDSISKAK